MPEPLGGAHRDPEATARSVGETVAKALAELEKRTPEQLLEGRYRKFRSLGVYQES